MTQSNPLSRADVLRAAGRPADAVTLLRQAGDAGDVDALYRLATWYLVGDPVPRDLATARGLLRRAVAIGHVDAALIEIALTANGSGTAPDWPAAIALLRTAAAQDPVAADHLALLDHMQLTDEGDPVMPGRAEILSERPNVRLFRELITPDECRHIATVGNPMLEPALVADPSSGRLIQHPIRTSHSAVIGPAHEDLVVQAINRRLAVASGTRFDQGEPLVVLRYAPGQQYRAHLDALPGVANQRIHTMLVYLNGGYRGGETHFLSNGLTVSGRTGDVLLFDNIDIAGTPDPLTRHAGMPVSAGNKWMATRWIRRAPHDPWQTQTR